jgi:hypothetical protein
MGVIFQLERLATARKIFKIPPPYGFLDLFLDQFVVGGKKAHTASSRIMPIGVCQKRLKALFLP